MTEATILISNQLLRCHRRSNVLLSKFACKNRGSELLVPSVCTMFGSIFLLTIARKTKWVPTPMRTSVLYAPNVWVKIRETCCSSHRHEM